MKIGQEPLANGKKHSESVLRYLNRLTATIAAGLTLLVVLSLVWNIIEEREKTKKLAVREALVTVNKDLAFRIWATRHGGVYVPATEATPPSPYLSHIPDRDVAVPNGKKLTLLNPAYMMRQVIKEYQDTYGVTGHVTSLKVVNPSNVPDPWEQRALEAFDRGAREVVEVVEVDGKPFVRFMRPMITGEGCLRCHAFQGYKVGDIGGGVAVSVPLAPYMPLESRAVANLTLYHALFWLLGMAMIGIAYVKGRAVLAEHEKSAAALRDSEETMRTLAETTVDAIIMLDNDATVTYWNPAAERIFGYSRSEALGKDLHPLITPGRIHEAFSKGFAGFKDTGQGPAIGKIFDETALRRDGTEFPVELSVSAVKLKGKWNSIGIIRDITERKRTARVLNEAQRIARLGSWELDLEKDAFVWSDEVYRIFGVEPQEFEATWDAFLQAVHPEDRACVNEAFGTSLEKESSHDIYHRIVRRDDGAIRYVHDVWEHQRDTNGEVARSIGIVHDITELTQAEKALAEKSQLIEAVFAQSPAGIAVLDRQLNFVQVNEAYAGFDGRSTDQFPGKNHFELYPSEAKAIFEQVVATGEPFTAYASRLIYPFPPKAQASYWDWSLAPLNDSAGAVDKLILTIHDVTERERAEEKVREQKDFLNRVIASLSHPFYVIDSEDYTIRMANPASGFDAGSGRLTCHALTHKSDTPCNESEGLCPLEAVKETKKPVIVEHTHYDPAGVPSIHEIHGYPVLDAAGNVRQMIEYVLDITERREAEERIKQQMGNLSALRLIDMAITGSLDLSVTLTVLLQQTVNQLKADAACVLLLNPHTQVLEYAASIGFTARHTIHGGVPLGRGYAGRVALERKTRVIPERADESEEAARGTLFGTEGFKAYVGTPLISKGVIKGVLEVLHRSPFYPDQTWIDFVEALAGQGAIAAENAELFEHLQRSHSELLMAYDTTIEGWSRALDYRDRETEGHSRRVTEMTIRLAQAAGIAKKEIVHIRRGALLHDIGKLGVPDNILLKPGKLTDEEWVNMRRHPDIAFRLLSPVSFLRPAIDIPYCHHERWDGKGYPRRLAAEEIPIAARMFSVVDIWDALRSDRPYRSAWSANKVREYLASEAGTSLEPQIVELFLKIEGSPAEDPE